MSAPLHLFHSPQRSEWWQPSENSIDSGNINCSIYLIDKVQKGCLAIMDVGPAIPTFTDSW